MIFDILFGGFPFHEVLIILAALALAIVIAITLHEVSHAYVAFKCGDPSAKLAGRLSLNPAKHFEPLGLVCFLVAGVGWAKPVPVNPFNYRNFKRGNFFVSIAGIATNILVAFVCSFVFYLLSPYGNSDNIFLFGLFYLFYFCMIMNLSLAVFNLLPIPPLDGYNMLVSFTKPNNGFMRAMRENSMIMLMIMVLFGGFIIFAIRGALESAFLALWGAIL